MVNLLYTQNNSNEIDNAISNVRLEGIDPSPDFIAKFKQASQAGINTADFIVKYIKSIRSGQI